MRLLLWLLDLGTETVEGRPEVWLWGLDERGQRVLVADRSATPHLYVLPAPGTDPASLRDAVRGLRQRLSKVADAEVVERRFLGKPVNAVRVSTLAADSASTNRIVKQIGGLAGASLDSLFLKNDPAPIERFVARVGEELGLEIRPEKVYQRLLFTEAKKRYAGILADGTLEVVGLEVVRGDWAQVAKDAQEEVLGLILRGRPIEEARDRARQLIGAVKRREVPYRDLVIWKTLSKPLRLYETRAPHVEAARRLFKAGYSLTIGDHVGYVIVKGEGKLYERAIPYHLTTCDAVDVEYYATHQVAPAAARVLGGFGVGEGELLR